MNKTPDNRWSARLAWAALLLALGAGVTIWLLNRSPDAARFFAIDPAAKEEEADPLGPTIVKPREEQTDIIAEPAAPPADEAKVAELDERLASVEQRSAEVESSADRADALLIAFAARRAIERGMNLGYLEPLLTRRFGPHHPAAVARLIRFARAPVTRQQLIDQFDLIAPSLDNLAVEENWFKRLKGELADIISVRRADQPPAHQAARVTRARTALDRGDVDVALAEMLRLRGVEETAGPWLEQARRYLDAQNALDTIEAAALNGEIAISRRKMPSDPDAKRSVVASEAR